MKAASSSIYGRFTLAVTVCLILAHPVFALNINSAVATGNQLTIVGTGFSGRPLEVIFNGSRLTIDSSTPTEIVATIDPLPPAGTYRLVVKSGTTSSVAFVTISNIVAKVSFLNQSASISPTTIFSPSADGLFRISAYMVQVPPYPAACSIGCGSATLSFEWTDDAGLQSQVANTNLVLDLIDAPLCALDFLTQVCPPMLSAQGSIPGATFVVRSKASTQIVYSVVYGLAENVDGVPTYDLFMTVEQLM